MKDPNLPWYSRAWCRVKFLARTKPKVFWPVTGMLLLILVGAVGQAL